LLQTLEAIVSGLYLNDILSTPVNPLLELLYLLNVLFRRLLTSEVGGISVVVTAVFCTKKPLTHLHFRSAVIATRSATQSEPNPPSLYQVRRYAFGTPGKHSHPYHRTTHQRPHNHPSCLSCIEREARGLWRGR
jgi:hypothetical protein